MNSTMRWAGFLATVIIGITLPLYAIMEPSRQEHRIEELRQEAVLTSTDIYAENCAICHGAAGEGLGATPALDSDGLRSMDETELYRVIERGRSNTVMAGWSIEEGGILQNHQIEQLVTFIQYADWYQTDENYDVMAQFNEVQAGSSTAWRKLISNVRRYDLTDPKLFQTVEKQVDMSIT